MQIFCFSSNLWMNHDILNQIYQVLRPSFTNIHHYYYYLLRFVSMIHRRFEYVLRRLKSIILFNFRLIDEVTWISGRESHESLTFSLFPIQVTLGSMFPFMYLGNVACVIVFFYIYSQKNFLNNTFILQLSVFIFYKC